MKKYTKKIIFCFILIASISLISLAQAQTTNNDVVLTWKALNFYPSNYPAKAEVSPGSNILISATGISNNSFVDLSNAEILWYVDGNLFKNQVGVKEIQLNAENKIGGSYSIRVEINSSNFNGTETINIPVGKPEAVIEFPYTSTFFDQNSPVVLESTPYFFNVNSFNQLTFGWRVNNIYQDNETRMIQLDSSNPSLNQGYNVIHSLISNSEDVGETAKATQRITISR